jgi:hypothetical protein
MFVTRSRLIVRTLQIYPDQALLRLLFATTKLSVGGNALPGVLLSCGLFAFYPSALLLSSPTTTQPWPGQGPAVGHSVRRVSGVPFVSSCADRILFNPMTKNGKNEKVTLTAGVERGCPDGLPARYSALGSCGSDRSANDGADQPASADHGASGDRADGCSDAL